MLNNLLLASLISLGAGAMAPAPLHNKSNLATSDQTTQFTLSVDTTNYVTSNNGRFYNRKYTYQNYNNALLIKGNAYSQSFGQIYDGNNQQIVEYWSEDTNIGRNTLLYAIQITPYKYLYDTNISLNINVYFDMQSQYNNWDQLKIRFNVLQSLQSSWSSYIDIANYYVDGNNLAIYSDAINTQNGYIYNHNYYEETITLNDDDQQEIDTTINKTINLSIVNQQTNYCLIYIDSVYLPNENRTSREIDTNYKYVFTPANNMTATGLMIPPVQNYEIIDLPGTMFYVLTMPFTFISTAFNLTLFPGTMYQFNIGNIFLTIIGVLSFIFLIRIFTRNK